jgi:hypothetical protein
MPPLVELVFWPLLQFSLPEFRESPFCFKQKNCARIRKVVRYEVEIALMFVVQNPWSLAIYVARKSFQSQAQLFDVSAVAGGVSARDSIPALNTYYCIYIAGYKMNMTYHSMNLI